MSDVAETIRQHLADLGWTEPHVETRGDAVSASVIEVGRNRSMMTKIDRPPAKMAEELSLSFHAILRERRMRTAA